MPRRSRCVAQQQVDVGAGERRLDTLHVAGEERGLTTQNCDVVVSSLSIPARISAVMTTWLKSSVRRIERTVPSTTSLCLIWLCPALRPSAVLNVMSMVGPRSVSVVTAR